jgi:hypothetical protein
MPPRMLRLGPDHCNRDRNWKPNVRDCRDDCRNIERDLAKERRGALKSRNPLALCDERWGVSPLHILMEEK